jgi:hypothetical protein
MKWDYRVEPFAFDDVGLSQRALNNMGGKGWELVAIVPTVWGKDQAWPAAIYKRPQPKRRKSN